jgi:hypothetical protein
MQHYVRKHCSQRDYDRAGIIPVLRGDVHTRSTGDQLDLPLAAHRSVGDREGKAQVRDITLQRTTE